MTRVHLLPTSTVSLELRRNNYAALGYTTDSTGVLRARWRVADKSVLKLDVGGVA